MFKALITEIVALSHAMGIEFQEDLDGAKSEDCGTTGNRRQPPLCREMCMRAKSQK